MKKIILVLLIISLNAGNAYSEFPEIKSGREDDLHSRFSDVMSKLTDDFKWIITSPARLEKSDIPQCAKFAGTLGLLMVLDEGIQNVFPDKGSGAILDGLFSVTGELGNGFVAVPLAGALYLAGQGLKDKKLSKIGTMGLESYIFTGILTVGMKVVLGRSRPEKNAGAWKYNLFTLDVGEMSFPSAHTSTAFSLASVIAGQYNIWVDVSVYTLAGLTALSRIYHNKHWASDVFAGAVLGILVGRAVVHLNSSEKSKKLALMPYFVPEERLYGVKLVAWKQ